MIPVDIKDVADSLAAGQTLYKTGFQNTNNAYSLYKELGEDVRKLVINLDLLLNVLQRAQYQEVAFTKGKRHPVPARCNHQSILGDFQETIGACEHMLSDQRYFQKSDGIVDSFRWDAQIKPVILALRDCITNHNIKLSILFSILDHQVFEDRSFHIVDSTASIFETAERLRRSVHEEEDKNDLPHAWKTGSNNSVPSELEDVFTRVARQTDPDLFHLARGIDGAVWYLNQITNKHTVNDSSDVTYHSAVINIMMALWLIKTIKASKEYQVAASQPSDTVFSRQLEFWGMTIARFCDRIENLLQEVLRRLLGRHLVLPPISDLLAILESHQHFNQQSLNCGLAMVPQQNEQLLFELEDTSNSIAISSDSGEQRQYEIKQIGVDLQSADPNFTETLQIENNTHTRSTLVILKRPLGNGREKEISDNYELNKVQIIPVYAMRTWAIPPSEPQTIVFRTDLESPFSRTLVFQQIKDMLEFQQKVTGYRVVHDSPRVLTTSQQAKILGGFNRQDLCRVQLWSAPTPKDKSQTTPESLSSSLASSYLVNSKSFTMSQTSLSYTSSSSFSRQSKGRSTPSIFSVASRSSSPSVAIDTPSYIAKSSRKNNIYVQPIAPCVVLFAHKAPGMSERVEGKNILRSFLTIEIGPDVTVEEELDEDEADLDSASHCCVIERKSNCLQARRSLETSDPNLWNLAAIGISQQEKETEVVKKMKHVILQFDDKNERAQFITKFNQLKAVASLKLAKFMGATGGLKC